MSARFIPLPGFASVPVVLPDGIGDDDRGTFLRSVASLSPYLRSLIGDDPQAARKDLKSSISEVEIAARALEAALDDAGPAMAGTQLRRVRHQLHRLLALNDLAGVIDWQTVCPLLSDFADKAVALAVSCALAETPSLARHCIERAGRLEFPGLFVLALGKLGGRELNFSSDIDLVLMVDPARFDGDSDDMPKLMQRFVRQFTQTISGITPEGFVFRLDLRLRPDPGSTQAVVTVPAALRYYEAQGRTWERAAYIKARCIAGDGEAATDFLRAMRPFVWRRSLDFYALDELNAMQLRVAEQSAEGGFDVKRGQGGIRAIEVAIQILQLVFGGRQEQLRVPASMSALNVLERFGHIGSGEATSLRRAYHLWRQIEHRCQMIADEQTHLLRDDPDHRRVITALMGMATLSDFDCAVGDTRDEICALVSRSFGPSTTPDAPSISADAVPVTAVSARSGFHDVEAIRKKIAGWQSAGSAVGATLRARRAIAELTPVILQACEACPDPDGAFEAFSRFLENTQSRAALWGLLQARPLLLRQLVWIIALSPFLAEKLTAQPAALDILLDTTIPPVLTGRVLSDRLNAEFAATVDFEGGLNAARRVVREMTFHIGAQTLLGRCHPALLGRARARLADRVISAYVPAVLARTRAYAEEMIAGEFVVLALGKYGGAELGPRSDLDMIFVGIPHADSEEPGRFFNKAAQRLIGALTVPTEEGPMYDVDMKLRPMGAKGSLCTSLPFFTRYYEQDAWVWEFMALTRARIVAGRPKGRRILNEVLNRLALRHFDSDQLWNDAQSMRARVAENRSGRGVFDVKYADGGFVDIEFAVQVLLLAHLPQEGRRWPATLNGQISALARAGHLSPAEAGALDDAVTLLLATREVASLFGLERGEALAPVAQAILAPWFDTDEEGFVERFSAAKARAGDIAHAILSGPR